MFNVQCVLKYFLMAIASVETTRQSSVLYANQHTRRSQVEDEKDMSNVLVLVCCCCCGGGPVLILGNSRDHPNVQVLTCNEIILKRPLNFMNQA